MSELADQAFHRILIIKPSSAGDIIHALPVLHGLRNRFQDAHIAWLVSTPLASLIEADPALNEVIPFDRKRFGRMLRSPKIAREFAGFVKDLRAKAFDLVVDLQGLFRSGFLAYATGAKVRVGFAAAREFAPVFYSHKFTPAASAAHAVDKNLQIAGLLGVDAEEAEFAVSITPEDRQTAAKLLKAVGFLPGQRYVVIVPSTRWETKCWPADRLGPLAQEIRHRFHLDSVFVGGSSDVSLADQAATDSGGVAKNLCGKTTLRELAALIHGAAIVVTADSMPMHLAAALHRPLVALFGPTNPDKTGPYHRDSDVLRTGESCSPCYLRRLSQCRYKHACMMGLDVESVLEAVAARLTHTGAEARHPGDDSE